MLKYKCQMQSNREQKLLLISIGLTILILTDMCACPHYCVPRHF